MSLSPKDDGLDKTHTISPNMSGRDKGGKVKEKSMSRSHRRIMFQRRDKLKEKSRDIIFSPKDDGPDKTQREAGVAVHDIVAAHVLQMDALVPQELQRFVDVLQAVDAHVALRGPGLGTSNVLLFIQDKKKKLMLNGKY